MVTNTRSLGSLLLSPALLALLLCSPGVAGAQSLSRGPYLQNQSTTAITVRWRTSANSNATVRYGTNVQNLTQSVSSATSTTEHELRVSGLTPDTKYYYSVGTSTTTLASGIDYFFVTSPAQAKPTRVWVIGDAGTGSAGQRAVRDAYYNYTGARGTDLWLMLGDNAYDNGTDSDYQSKVFDVYRDLLRNSTVWSTLGNHDGHSASSATLSGPYYAMFSFPRSGEAGGVASGTEAYYAFDYGNIHFVCLNSYDVDRSATGAMLSWLRNDLAANTKDWLITFFHHPPYSKGSHNSDTETELVQMRQNALPILESFGVDLVLGGHSHAYERTYLIDGHYGTSSTLHSSMILDNGSGRQDGSGAYLKSAAGPVANEGAVYVVTGASGQASGGALNHPAMYVSLNVLGSMVIDVDANRLDAKYLDSVGAVRDYFTMLKGEPQSNALPSVAITSPASAASFDAPATVPIIASANDSDGSIVRVDFYQGSTLIGSDATSPYAVTWTDVPAGSYSLSAVAFDDDGAQKTSEAVPISVVGSTGPQVTVSFQNGSGGYNGMVDATIRSNRATSNYGGSTTLLVDGSPDYATAMRWDLSAVPMDKTVTSAALTFRVSNRSANSYELYALNKAWNESQITWQRASTSSPWQSAGANGAADRDSSGLASVNGSTTGDLTVSLNAAGLAKVQAWVSNPQTNYGVILLNYDVSDGLDLRSSEYRTVAYRPRLTLTYH